MHLKHDPDVLVMHGRTKEGLQRETRFWAERGLIHCEDSIHGYEAMSVKSFVRKAQGINDMLGNGSKQDTGFDAHLREVLQRNVEQAIRIAEKAKVQGMPTDASARRDLVRRRAKTVCVTDHRGVM